MRASGACVLGVIVGAAVVWLWGRKVEEYVKEHTRGMRTKAAEGVQASVQVSWAAVPSVVRNPPKMTVLWRAAS